MVEWLFEMPVWCVALILGGFCFLCTAIGAFSAFFCQNLNKKYVSILLAFAGGIMIASSFFSLILPALEFCGGVVWKEVVFVVAGFLLGTLFIVLTNILFDKKFDERTKENNARRKSMLISTSITMHNIPEGMAVGVAVGGAIISGDMTMLLATIALGVGIGIQNIPEGASIALALKCQGVKTGKAFLIGTLSGVVEPIFAVIASVLTVYVLGVLPAFLAFSAGAMMLVAVSELLPEALEEHKLLSVIFFAIGFAVMALCDVVL